VLFSRVSLPRVLSLSLTAAVALCVAGCDRQSEEGAQPEEAGAGSSEQLTGILDRSFAGQPMPAAMLLHPEGERLALDDTRGTPVLLNLWATWCAPCVVEMPLLDGLAGELDGEVRVLTVSEDMQGAEAVVPFFEGRDLDHLPRWMDPQNELAVAFGGGAALPLTVLYDAQGREVWRVMGAYDWSSAEAREEIAAGLAGEG